MKKILLCAMVVLGFMACNNGVELPANDKKAMDVVTAGAIDMLGAEQANVQKAFTDAGYLQVTEGQNKISKRIAAKAPKKVLAKEEAHSVDETYIYGLPENYEQMSDEERMAYLNQLLADGKSYIEAEVSYADGKLTTVVTTYATGKRPKVNTVYTAKSSAMYSKLPSQKEMKEWMGEIAEDTTTYTDHAAFVAKVAAADSIVAYEMATGFTEYSETRMSGFYYISQWGNPGAATEEAMRKEGYTPYVYGAFQIFAFDESAN